MTIRAQSTRTTGVLRGTAAAVDTLLSTFGFLILLIGVDGALGSNVFVSPQDHPSPYLFTAVGAGSLAAAHGISTLLRNLAHRAETRPAALLSSADTSRKDEAR
ncbi:hypothetical protein ACFP1Z_06660 [Streptomyces gamaensis]|uniref:Uncharacterized protein n=1 Tax=Streptomyces gamaensis TaxID=1763542 RepID=A0ABW0YYV0_9ACTN